MLRTLRAASLLIGFACLAGVSAFAGTVQPAPVPEPATIALIGTGVATVLGIRYYRSRPK